MRCIASLLFFVAAMAAGDIHVYRTTPDRQLKISFDYPEGWKASDRRPAVIFFYNGGWGTGSPERQFEDQACYLTARGAVTARADYRVKNRDGVETPRKCVEDVLSGVRWVRANAARFGIDPQAIATAGGSGSAHLVASVAYAAEEEALPGAMLIYHPDLDDLTPAMIEKMVSPETARRLPPTVVFIGSRDPMIEMTREWTGKLRQHGAPIELFVGEGGLHGFYKFSPWLERTTWRADALLQSVGHLKPHPRVAPPALPAPAGYGKRIEENQERWMARHRSRRDPPQPEYVYQTYGERELRIVFHYPPAWSRADRRPAIFFFSGGAHSPSDKNGRPYPTPEERVARGLPVINDGPGNAFLEEAEYFARRGMVAGRVEYRQRSTDGVLPDESSRDAARAIRWVRKNAGKLGIDPDRLVAAGGSGGGHLVASVAALREVHGMEGVRPDALVLHFPLLDWLEGGRMTERLLGALNNDRDLAARLSPSRHWNADMPPTLLFIGEKEPTFEVNLAFARKWMAEGAPVELFVGEGAGHGFSRVSPWIEKATARTDEFLRKLGYLEEEPRVALPSRGKGGP